ncbi:uncharacterized protein [Clytia hemisphaerica]|uniref:uncharacterized protein n=1 Tax=Clytia hemisphaerica TaxID=252671 RepID=UPI0034D61831
MGFQFQPTRSGEKTTTTSKSLTTPENRTNQQDQSEIIGRSERNDWCKCDRCSVMTAYGFLEEDECICCHEIIKKADPYYATERNKCATQHPDFTKFILDESYLYMGLVSLHDLFSDYLPPRDKATTRNYRYAAYRHFTWWANSKGKKNVRRRLPACVLRTIRERFPAPDGVYVGFKAGVATAESRMSSWRLVEEEEELDE